MIHVLPMICVLGLFPKNKLKNIYPNFVNYTNEPPLDPMGIASFKEVETRDFRPHFRWGPNFFHWVSSFDKFFHGIPKYSTIN